ncbi:hypothetical protein HNY73_007386 [Argiope bruennichi]|uniref:Uncharacterized protein n=1 Tax=Argiope bruennichi TaxID=94029 RepID=A0A8T0FIU0_ARGBR|nr:hypothetical protein HNY73_007386 [Argiope bruennichi]
MSFIPNFFGWLAGLTSSVKWEWKETIQDNGRGPAGSSGTNGANSAGLQDPVPPNGIRRLPNVINEYKSYLRENLNNRFKSHSLLRFLEQINSRNDMRKLYDTLGLIDEFQSLEEQFHLLRDQINFLPFYSSLLERISEFAKGPNSGENKKVLSYLYTATLGRMYNLKDCGESELIINIREYLNLANENIKTLKDLQKMNNKVEVINKYKENYKKGIDKKIAEAKSFIKNQISPEIENIKMKIDSQLNSLIEETITLQKQAEKERNVLVEKKKELENALAMKGIFSCFQLISGIVSFINPVGAIVGAVIEATSTVAESLVLGNQQKTLNLSPDVVSAIKSAGDQIKELKNQKVAYLSKLLDNVSEEIKKNPEKLSDMAGKINDIKDKLKKASEDKNNFKQVKMLENELKRELRRKEDDLKIHSNDKKSVEARKVIGKITQIAKFGSLLLNLFDKMKADTEKMDAVTEAMEKLGDKIKKLREYEDTIYDTIEPMLQEMEDHMKEISEKLGSKSQVSLDVTKWQVQSTLKDMKLQMERLTEGFVVKDELSRSIEKLDEVMTTMINLYDRIQSYQNQHDLANYIADISSVSASNIPIKDQLLVNAVNRLEFAIRANIVLKQYKSAMDAFKQWVFPFADSYIEKSMLPSQLELDTNIQNLVQNATREIERIKQKLDLYNASVKNGDQYLVCEEFSSRYVSSQPFFTWRNEEYGGLISNLLSGQEIVLKADIKKSPPLKDAIKFSEIDFDFKTINESAQSLLSETLKGFDIRATHLGNSYYRYADKVFLITSDSVTISYSFEKNNDGMPIRSNEVYNKLKSGDLLLSPYTLWEIRLINRTHQYFFQDLESYKNAISLELSGFGSYVDMNAFRPATYNSFIMGNSSNLPLLMPKATGVNQCRRSKYRLERSPNEFVEDRYYMNNGATNGMSSPINFLCNFLKTYFISNAIISINQLFIKEEISVRSYEDCSGLSEKYPESKISDSTLTSNLTVTDTVVTDAIFPKYKDNEERNEQISDTSFQVNFDGDNSCSKSFLLNNQKDRSNNYLIQAPDLNCSLLLADLVTRTITGNRYESSMHECLLSPREVIAEKINHLEVQSENGIKQNLQRLLSEKEDVRPNSWLSMLNGYTKTMLQFLGLAGSNYSQEYIQDVRNLFI